MVERCNAVAGITNHITSPCFTTTKRGPYENHDTTDDCLALPQCSHRLRWWRRPRKLYLATTAGYAGIGQLDRHPGTDNTRPARLLDRRPDEKRPTRANAGNAINTGAARRNKDRVAAQYTPHKNNKLHRK